MNRDERSELCRSTVERFALSGTATYKDACHRAGQVMSEVLGASVELKFVTLRNSSLSGATMRRPDGTYVIYCVTSRSWYHRLGILLHELAHLLLGHHPVTLDPGDGLRRFAPNLPGRMARLVAGRTSHTEDEERDAEELADELLEHLTERHRRHPDALDSAALAPHVLRIAEGLAHPGWRDRGDA
jgi:hypothetical protein